MEKKELILKIVIPEYPRELQIAKEARPKYYEWTGITIKCKSKKLLQKYINPIFKNDIIKNNGNVLPIHLKEDYRIVGLKGNKVYSYIDPIDGECGIEKLTVKQNEKPTKYILCEPDSNNGEVDLIVDRYTKVIANATKAGKPRYQIIKGQDMYSGNLNEFTRAKIVNFLKEFYYQSKFKDLSISANNRMSISISESYPLYVKMEIVDTIRNYYDRTKTGEGGRWDVGNRAYPYIKTFVDFLVNGKTDSNFNGFVKDDDRLHVSGEGYYFTPCLNHDDRKLIFYIYKDNRELWNRLTEFID